MRINPTLQQLAGFLHLARSGSFSEAARLQGVSQPALSRTVQQLEEVVGQRLFDRTTRSVALTPTGQELLPIAERLIAEFDSSFGELARFVAGLRGRVVVAALPSLAAVLLPPAIARFREGHPDVELAIMDGLSGSVLDAVDEGRADIGLTIRPNPRATLRTARSCPTSSAWCAAPMTPWPGKGRCHGRCSRSGPSWRWRRRAASGR
jgi:DNA-binding transcriptional LysR family regulator